MANEDRFSERLEQLKSDKSPQSLVKALEWVHQILEISALLSKEVLGKTDADTIKWIYSEIIENYVTNLEHEDLDEAEASQKKVVPLTKNWYDDV